MLTRILDTSEIDMNDPEISAELDMDLRRMDKMGHEEKPEGSDVYCVKVMPSITTYRPGMHRFRFAIQYGNLKGREFVPETAPLLKQTETLPMI